MKTSRQLQSTLYEIDRRSYPAYKALQGAYDFGAYLLCIDHVQGDPFAAPSKLHVEVSGREAGFPRQLYDTPGKKIALQDYLTRVFGEQVSRVSHKAYGSGKSGLISVSRPGQEILERSCFTVDAGSGGLLVRLEVGFPANGRTIQAAQLEKILFEFLPECVAKSLFYRSLKPRTLTEVADLCEDQEFLRQAIARKGLTAFVANGSILPRVSGVSEKPMKEAVAFSSPASLEVEFDLPHLGKITGMGIPRGVTLVVGGGFHGKSTLLEALEKGVYNHIAGDGREYVVTDSSAWKLRAEDSRYVGNADISLFINHLPNKGNTTAFTTLDASGSTSQAANVVEGIEAGTKLFLIDEDTSATNFMIRDELMQRVVAEQEEPITPFISRVRALYEKAGISSVIVAGSSGAFFHVADTVIQMKEYVPLDITAKAKEAAKDFPELSTGRLRFALPDFGRIPRFSGSFGSGGRGGRESGRPYYGRGRAAYAAQEGAAGAQEHAKIRVMGMDGIQVDKNATDLRYLEQLVDPEQLCALAYLLVYARSHYLDGKRSLTQVVDALERQLEEKGLASLAERSYLPSGLCRPRRQEIFACFNRCRELKF
ncbi:MAG: ABC-ATPase domain-containing protein [Clostridium sp.]|jgi:predicted ABC-class ATPase|nr:ABC-ATPase domain-containing protein [Clostridium sp.]